MRAVRACSGARPARPPDRSRRLAIEAALDRGLGSCLLDDERFARIVIDNRRHFDGLRYDLCAGVVMPNHVHVLLVTAMGIHCRRAISYIHENPVKAGLVERVESWRWSSAWAGAG